MYLQAGSGNALADLSLHLPALIRRSRFLRSYEGIETGSPKGTIRGFFQTGYLTDAQTKCGLEMVDDRNLTSHTYNEALSERIFQKLPEYAALMDSWLSSMSEKLK